MMFGLHFSSARAASIVLVVAFLCQDLAAQAYDQSADPFVQSHTSIGESMMSPMSNRYYDLNHAFNQPLTRLYVRFPTLFFPPLPPVIGAKVANTAGPGFGSGFAANIDREIFYAAYTSLASVDELRPLEIARVDAYRKAGEQLLEEIRAKLDELAKATPAARAAALAELATQQDSRLRARAEEAEGIRQALIHWKDDMDDFRLGGTRLVSNASEQATLQLLFASSFTAGLSTEQRRLLPEIASDRATRSEKTAQEWSSGSTFFFLPETSRIQPPANLPAPLEAKIRAFVHERESLKRELRSHVLRDYLFRSSRTKRLAALAQQQAPRFAALETLAEEIRAGLTALGFPDQMQLAAWPADLTERVGKFYARKVEVRRELRTRLRELQDTYVDAKFEIKREGDGLAIVGTGIDRNAAASLAEFNAGQAGHYAEFAIESAKLRRDILHYTENSPLHLTHTVDQVAADFGKAYAARKSLERYRDYRRAVLEPGLSAAQRRVLFQSATAELEQSGELLSQP